jgi:Arc/MetJ-type ribon-helix-helix transcriptional regulator
MSGVVSAGPRSTTAVASEPVSRTLKATSNDMQNNITIHLTPEQGRRVQAFISRGAYQSVEEVVDAALAAVEQRTAPGFAGTQEELDALLAEELASKELTEDEFWGSVNKSTEAMLAEHKSGPRS